MYERNSSGLVPPLARSYWISRSPAVRYGRDAIVREHVLGLVELEVHVGRAASGPGRGARTGAGSRRLQSLRGTGRSSVRSLLFGGMLPSTTVGHQRCLPSSPGRTSRRPSRWEGPPCALSGIGADPRSTPSRWSPARWGRADFRRRRPEVRVGVDLEVAAGQADLWMVRRSGYRDEGGEGKCADSGCGAGAEPPPTRRRRVGDGTLSVHGNPLSGAANSGAGLARYEAHARKRAERRPSGDARIRVG